jgi:molybdopterin/thiamine biosynthesis adenylyltransferase
MAGGFGRWKNEGRDWITPQSSTPSSATATAATSSSPRSARPASRSCSRARCCSSARAARLPAALYLAAAGVGTLGIVDMDVVDASNLQRQILHNMDRIGERKVDSAKKTLTALNPDVDVVTYDVRFGADNVLDIIDGYDVDRRRHRQLPDALPPQRRVAAQAHPVVHGSIFRFEGQVTVFSPMSVRATGACCPSRRRRARTELLGAGVIGVLPGIVGSIQALEAIKLSSTSATRCRAAPRV